jgi:hypothetical protein
MVIPACPPITGTETSSTVQSWFSATKVLALTTSRVVTPNNLFLLYVPFFLSTSAKIGTVEFTGLEIIQ